MPLNPPIIKLQTFRLLNLIASNATAFIYYATVQVLFVTFRCGFSVFSNEGVGNSKVIRSVWRRSGAETDGTGLKLESDFLDSEFSRKLWSLHTNQSLGDGIF